jgi:hypothetical protein
MLYTAVQFVPRSDCLSTTGFECRVRIPANTLCCCILRYNFCLFAGDEKTLLLQSNDCSDNLKPDKLTCYAKISEANFRVRLPASIPVGLLKRGLINLVSRICMSHSLCYKLLATGCQKTPLSRLYLSLKKPLGAAQNRKAIKYPLRFL